MTKIPKGPFPELKD
jgi:hypothetical protein